MTPDQIEDLAIHLKDHEKDPDRRKYWTIRRYKQTIYNRINLGWPMSELIRPIGYARRSMPMVKAAYAYERNPVGKLSPTETKQRLATLWRHSRVVIRRELTRIGVNHKTVPAMELMRDIVARCGWPPYKDARIAEIDGAICWTLPGVKGPLWRLHHK